MLSENELNSARIENKPISFLSVMFIEFILMAIIALSVALFNQQNEPRPTPHQELSVIFIPTASLPTEMPANYFSINLPIIVSRPKSEPVSVTVSEQIWKVTKIKNLGYELDGQRYDLATFTRLDGQETAKGYCINRGWDVPDIGTEYLLNAGGIFIPLHESESNPLQRFLMIQ